MKLIVSTIIATLLASSLWGATARDQSKLAADMRSMLSAVVDMQRAGFYSNKTGMKDAADRLTRHLDSLLTTDPKTYLPKDFKFAGEFAKKRERMIKLYAEDLKASIDAGQVEEAMENYGQILRQCNSCHLRIRNREWK
jgi:cytochrome c556